MKVYLGETNYEVDDETANQIMQNLSDLERQAHATSPAWSDRKLFVLGIFFVILFLISKWLGA